jgi:hypothetical protein
MLEGIQFMRGEYGRWQIRRLQTEIGEHESLPRFAPRRVKTYILLV